MHTLSSLGAFVLGAACLVACAAGGAGDGDGDFNVEQAGDDAATADNADAASSDSGYGGDASVHAPDANAPGQDSGGFPPPTGSDAGTTTFDSSTPDTGTTTHDSGTTSHDSGSTQSGCVAPDTAASCTACMTSGQTCQNNGCYNGYYCDTSTSKCYAQSSCP